MKRDKLIEFLTELDKDETLKQECISDPKNAAEKYGLDPDDVKICESNDVEAMKKRAEALGADTLNVKIAL